MSSTNARHMQPKSDSLPESPSGRGDAVNSLQPSQQASLTWADFNIEYKSSSYEPAVFMHFEDYDKPSPFAHFNHWFIATVPQENGDAPEPWIQYSSALHLKLLSRGQRTFAQVEIEEAIIEHAIPNTKVDLTNTKPENVDSLKTSIAFLADQRNKFHQFGANLSPLPSYFNPLDRSNPKNEARLLHTLREVAGPTISAYTSTQVPLDCLMPSGSVRYAAQRADFVITFPNGKGLVIEPGDHSAHEQARDNIRDRDFLKHFKYHTLRPANAEIDSPTFKESLREALSEIEVFPYLSTEDDTTDTAFTPFLALSYIQRLETVLSQSLLDSELWNASTVSILVLERDVAATELALESFLLQQQKIHQLYGQNFTPPMVHVSIRRSDYDCSPPRLTTSDFSQSLHFSEYQQNQTEAQFDLIIDASVTAGNLLAPESKFIKGNYWVIRNAPPHHARQELPTTQHAYAPVTGDDFEQSITPFLRDLFRKEEFRSDQVRILVSILSGEDTIGLLPTGGGKSICYQIAGLISPGCTIVVAPIIALMEDQAASLRNRIRLTRCETINSDRKKPLEQNEVADIMASNCFVFIAPERFQRDSFRDVIQKPNHAINLAAIDEGHCVSMWGHDFRPAYLRLPANIRNFCRTGAGSPPPIIALTGTASQIVLIDLKRILNVDNSENIIRPETFNRPELTFRVRQVPKGSGTKLESLKKVILPEIKADLKRKSLLAESFGIIFDYSPKKLWQILEKLDEKSSTEISQFKDAKAFEAPRIGFYAGSCPKSLNLASRWKDYKRSIFDLFTKEKVRCLLGNNAVSVGIDHSKVEYIVNMSMPQSLEDYYQQAGRAGRSGQPSLCYLLYSEEDSECNDKWLRDKTNTLTPEKWSDVGNAAYFHQLNFPGVEADQETLRIILNRLMTYGKETNYESVSLEASKIADDIEPDDVERFIGYLILIGVVHDYRLQGMKDNLIIHAELREEFVNTINANDHDAAYLHLLNKLADYYDRYSPQNREILKDQVDKLSEETHNNSKLVAVSNHLINFVYEKIEYQRRGSIKLITDYCRKAIDDEDKARQIISDTFNKSRFSNRLEEMRTLEYDFKEVHTILADVSDKAEAEQLVWETSRLLAEVDRADWRLVRSLAPLAALDSNISTDDIARDIKNFSNQNGPGYLLESLLAISHLYQVHPNPQLDVVLGQLVFTSYQDLATRDTCVTAISHSSYPSTAPFERAKESVTLLQLKQIHECLK